MFLMGLFVLAWVLLAAPLSVCVVPVSVCILLTSAHVENDTN